MIGAEEIINYLPQRMPFVMIDKLISSNDRTTTTSFKVLPTNIFVENGLLKEPGLLENIAQTAAARAGFTAKQDHQPVRVGYIGSIKNLLIYNFPKINDELITEISIENQIFDVSVISGKIINNGQTIAQCEMKIFIINQ